MNTNPAAAGFKTSEFWLSVLSLGLTVLVSHGVITSMQVNPIVDAVGQIYGGAIGLITIFAIIRSYIKSRTAIKTTMIQQAQNTPTNTAK